MTYDDEDVDSVKFVAGLCVVVIVITIIARLLYFTISKETTLQEYCDTNYGNNSFYDKLEGTTYELRSCDIITNNALKYNYFSYSKDYIPWSDKYVNEIVCPKLWELNKWSCWKK